MHSISQNRCKNSANTRLTISKARKKTNMNALTPLQKVGISFLLIDLMHHSGNMMLKHGGRMLFKRNEDGKFIDLYIIPNYEPDTRFHYTLDICENVDDSIEYWFRYDDMDKLFVINSKVVKVDDIC